MIETTIKAQKADYNTHMWFIAAHYPKILEVADLFPKTG